MMTTLQKSALLALISPLIAISCAHTGSDKFNQNLVSKETYEVTDSCYSFQVFSIERCDEKDRCQAYLSSNGSKSAVLAEIKRAQKGQEVIMCYVYKSSGGTLLNAYEKR